MLDRILKYMEDTCYYELDEFGNLDDKVVNYEDLKEFIEKLKKECE